MADYDLTGKLKKDFTFSINEAEFVFRKPTVREMRTLSKMFAAVGKETDTDEQINRSDEAMEALYAYIKPVNHERPIAEVLDEQPVDVQVGFNEMIQEQLGSK